MLIIIVLAAVLSPVSSFITPARSHSYNYSISPPTKPLSSPTPPTLQGWEDSISEFEFEESPGPNPPTAPTTATTTTTERTLQQKYPVGAMAKISIPTLKAFHINKKARGTFSEETKAFQADESSDHLKLPVGLTGTISRVYDLEELGANFPIIVKFGFGGEGDERSEFKLPPGVKLTMHFDSDEVELVN